MGVKWQNEPFERIAIGKGRKLHEGDDIAIVSIGTTGNFATEAIRQIESEGKYSVAHYDLRFAKPIDEELLHVIGARFDKVITIEDGVLRGGVGEAVVKFMNDNGYNSHIRCLGIDDKFIEHGTPAELYALCGYDATSIVNAIKELLK